LEAEKESILKKADIRAKDQCATLKELVSIGFPTAQSVKPFRFKCFLTPIPWKAAAAPSKGGFCPNARRGGARKRTGNDPQMDAHIRMWAYGVSFKTEDKQTSVD
jgi:hypothetical protein